MKILNFHRSSHLNTETINLQKFFEKIVVEIILELGPGGGGAVLSAVDCEQL